MDIIQVSSAIQQTINEIRATRKTLRPAAEKKTEKEAAYNKKLAITIMGLKHGESFKVDGIEISGHQVSVLEKLAKAVCWQEALEKDKADLLYKNCIEGLRSLQSELNGYQSIFSKLETM